MRGEARRGVDERPLPRVLILSLHLPTEKDPTAGIFVYDQAEALYSRADVTVGRFTLVRRGPLIAIRPAMRGDRGVLGVEVACRDLHSSKLNSLVRYVAMWMLISHLARRGRRPEVIHVHWWRAARHVVPVAKLRRTPVVITEHGSTWAEGTMSLKDLKRGKRVLRLATRVVVVSRWLQEVLTSQGVEANFVVLPNVVDIDAFHPGPQRAGTRPVALVVARLTPDGRKGVDDAIRAIGQLLREGVECELRIIGDGLDRDRLETLTAELGLTELVRFMGTLDRAEIARELRSADILISAVRTYETFGVAIAEALASGTPVVATDAGAVKELMNPDNGVLVEPCAPEALAAGIRDALVRTWNQGTIALSAQEFSRDRIGDRLTALYQGII